MERTNSATQQSGSTNDAARDRNGLPPSAGLTIHLIVACHNRKAMTVDALNLAKASAEHAGVKIDFTIVDDGSTDGTAHAVRDEFGKIAEIITGDGTWFWAKSMAIAERHVLDEYYGEPNAIVLWLNDDTQLTLDAISQLVEIHRKQVDAIVIGTIQDPDSDEISYGGYLKSGLHPLRYRRAIPTGLPMGVDAFNGNCVLVPVRVATLLGGIDGSYSHSLADFDYGVRCKKAGIPMIASAAVVGICSRGDRSSQGSLVEKWRAFIGIKGGGHYGSLVRVLRKAAPRTWFIYLTSTYVLWWIRTAIHYGLRWLSRNNAP